MQIVCRQIDIQLHGWDSSYVILPTKSRQTLPDFHAAEEKKITTTVRRKLGKKNLKGYVLTLPSPSNQFIYIVTTIIGCIHELTTKCLFCSMPFHLYSHHNHNKGLIVLISQNTFKIHIWLNQNKIIWNSSLVFHLFKQIYSNAKKTVHQKIINS